MEYLANLWVFYENHSEFTLIESLVNYEVLFEYLPCRLLSLSYLLNCECIWAKLGWFLGIYCFFCCFLQKVCHCFKLYWEYAWQSFELFIIYTHFLLLDFFLLLIKWHWISLRTALRICSREALSISWVLFFLFNIVFHFSFLKK